MAETTEPDLLAAAPTDNLPVYTVGEISGALKRTIEDRFGAVRVRGEVSGLHAAASGHLYMSLKDADAVLDAVCWRTAAARLSFAPEDGLEVVCRGRLTTYAGRSKYQLVIETLEPAGIGAWMALLETRRKALAAEGLFAAERKQGLPYLPDVIGVVTSESGAVIRDIRHRLRDRFPRHVLLWPVRVQGEGAAAEVAAAIEGFNRLAVGGQPPRPDVLIVARGGGSIEDLWAFNEEIVVRAAGASAIPLIAAIGHESDTTLIDLVADVRAPTPSAAAEMAVPVRAELAAAIGEAGRRLGNTMVRRMAAHVEGVRAARRGLRDPRELLRIAAERLDELSERLRRALGAGVQTRTAWLREVAAILRPGLIAREVAGHRRGQGELARRLVAALGRGMRETDSWLRGQSKLLESYSYHQVLRRGYAVVRDDQAKLVGGVDGVRPGLGLRIEFRDGFAEATARGAPRRRTRRTSKARDEDDQQEMF